MRAQRSDPAPSPVPGSLRRFARSSGGVLALALALLLAPAALAQQSLSPGEALAAARAQRLLLIDIRSPAEWTDTGVAEGAVLLDADGAAFEPRLAGLRLDNRGKRIALIDRTGGRASALQSKLAARGWRDIVTVRGGMLGRDGWLAEKLPVTAP